MITIDLFKKYITEHKFIGISYVVLCVLFYCLESILLPRMSAHLFSQLKPSTSKTQFDSILYSFFKIIGLWISIQAIASTTGFIESKVYPDVWEYMRNYVLKSILFRYQNHVQELELGKINTELGSIPGNFTEFLSVFFENVFTRVLVVFIIFIYFFFLNWKIGTLSFILMFVMYALYIMILRNCIDLSNERYQKFRDISEIIQDKLSNLATIYSTGNMDYEIQDIQKDNQEFKNIYHKQLRCTNTVKMIGYIFNILFFACINGLTLYLFKKGELNVTQFISIFITVLYLTGYLVRLTYQIPLLVIKYGIIEKTEEFLKEISKKNSKQSIFDSPMIRRGYIMYDKITFGYSKNEPIFKDLSLEIRPNTKTCIVGSSGSGKSTLLKLLIHFHPIQKGSIYIDGININNFETNQLRKQISYVNQNTKLFNKTIYENIQYSNPHLTKEMIDKKIQELGIRDIFKNLQYNLNKKVGVSGSKLSGGQKQVVIILRELLNTSSKILILDEPTASIDEKNKKYIHTLIQNISKDKTTIVITHDLENIKYFDKVYLLKDGQLTEQSSTTISMDSF